MIVAMNLSSSIRGVAVLAALGIVAGLAGCSGPGTTPETAASMPVDASGPPRLVFIYLPCTVNANYLDPYGSELGLTPNLAAFAERAATFTAHRTEAGYSGCAYASILTSQHVDKHQVYQHPRRLSSDLYDLSEALVDNGYEVYYWGGHKMAAPHLNYVQGATHSSILNLYESLEGFRRLIQEKRGSRIAVLATESVTHTPYDRGGLGWFTKYSSEFAALPDERVEQMIELFYDNLFDLKYRHDEFVAKAGLDSHDVRDLVTVVETLYRLNISFLDLMFGEYMSAVGEGAMIVFTADHGESLYNPLAEFKWTHGNNLFSEVLTVPLMIAGPGIQPGRHAFVTRSIDVAPTVAGLLDLKLPKSTGWTGTDLAPVIRGETAPPRLRAFSHTGFRPGRLGDVALRDGPLVAWYQSGVYSVRDVADEAVDVFDRANPAHVELVAALGAYRERTIAAYTANTTLTQEEQDEALRSLGYIE